MDRDKTDLCKLRPPKDFEELIQMIYEIFESDDVDVDYVQNLIASYKSKPSEWEKFAKFDEFRYTRNLVDEGNGKFNLIVLCWNEAQGSAIHDHADSHCFMKILDGELKETLFDWPKEEGTELAKTAERNFQTNECTYMCDEIGLHRVENPSFTDKAVSLHLYSPPFAECGAFDQNSGHKNMCKITFYSKNGVRTPFKPSEKNPGCASMIAENN